MREEVGSNNVRFKDIPETSQFPGILSFSVWFSEGRMNAKIPPNF